MKTRLGMEFWVDYSHTLRGHPTCGRSHGHTARILVEVEGEVTGGEGYQDNMLMDFKDLKEECKEVLDKVDHRDLNEIFKVPTSENIAAWIFSELKSRLPVAKVTFFEGNGKWCTIER